MSLAIFYGSALVWAFRCALVAMVAGAAVNGRTSYWKGALVGMLVGAVFGIIIVYLISSVGTVTFFLTFLFPAPLDRFSPNLASILLTAMAAAITGLAVGVSAGQSAPVVRRCVIVGVVFGLVLSIADVAVSLAAIPAIEGAGLGSLSAVTFGLVSMIVGATIDVALTVFSFRFVRRRWGGASTATATGN